MFGAATCRAAVARRRGAVEWERLATTASILRRLSAFRAATDRMPACNHRALPAPPAHRATTAAAVQPTCADDAVVPETATYAPTRAVPVRRVVQRATVTSRDVHSTS